MEQQLQRATAMRRDMSAQPDVLARLIERSAEIAALLQRLRTDPPAGILLVARGSSDHAATYGRYLLEAATGSPASLSANSLFTRYACATRLQGWLVIGISQSGATPEICEVLEDARGLGATTLAVTNDESSALAGTAELLVALGAGEEEAVPATKTYTATLAALALVAAAIGEPPWAAGSLESLPALLEHLLAAEPASSASQLLSMRQSSVHLGRGYLYCAALESALKLRETARVSAEAYSLSDFLHGPIAASDAGTVAVVHVGAGETRQDAESMLDALSTRHSAVIEAGPARLREWTDAFVEVPTIAEPLAAFPHAVVAQQLALGTALVLGLDPDRPAGLSKVTPTS